MLRGAEGRRLKILEKVHDRCQERNRVGQRHVVVSE